MTSHDEAHDILVGHGRKTIDVADSIARTSRCLLDHRPPAYLQELLEAQAQELRQIADSLEWLPHQ